MALTISFKIEIIQTAYADPNASKNLVGNFDLQESVRNSKIQLF